VGSVENQQEFQGLKGVPLPRHGRGHPPRKRAHSTCKTIIVALHITSATGVSAASTRATIPKTGIGRKEFVPRWNNTHTKAPPEVAAHQCHSNAAQYREDPAPPAGTSEGTRKDPSGKARPNEGRQVERSHRQLPCIGTAEMNHREGHDQPRQRSGQGECQARLSIRKQMSHLPSRTDLMLARRQCAGSVAALVSTLWQLSNNWRYGQVKFSPFP
jgi:hypothetical protein